ncbi:hypothetical protein [Vogesella indigofera]|uniref:hypothetical protein n=1 Tax=Vogesella indigofera TaxID=45465 RepID=UPI00234E6128|nr:hypothetical protein [Vogesella indigofera]MDC7700290.1 hypothetical protein [Vogesella indigofera]MDC7706789.1 hypothetical protein [Vogesella indigofera]
MNDEALQRLQKLVDGPRDGALLRFGLANEYARLEQWPQAIREARAALAFQHDYSAAWKLLGKVLLAGGEPQQALQAYRDGIAVAEQRGDKQAAKEMTVFARRIEKTLAASDGAS